MNINELRDKIEKQEVISVNELESLIRDWFLVADEGIIRLIYDTRKSCKKTMVPRTSLENRFDSISNIKK